MKLKNTLLASWFLIAGAVTTSCTDSTMPVDMSEGRPRMDFKFEYPSAARASETAFEQGDRTGLFVTEENVSLEIGGNIVTNEPLTLDGSTWKSANPLFWDNGRYNAFAYYPFSARVESVSDMPFSVSLDQRGGEDADGLTPYEKSDFLFASAKGLQASAEPVTLLFRHIMSKLTIRLIKGEDFEGDIPENATVVLHNTVPSATIDLSVGIATKAPKGAKASITARQESRTIFSVITVPQRLDNRVPLIEVVMNGVSFLFESKFQFKPGVNHLVNLVIDKNPEQVKIEIGGEIADWN